ncbi:amidohydrolase family protein [Brucella pseudogrignonensis]|uniref:amidohydrolase family protein n=1 Tax=Brucella pseudogrignonensis TaxID=419475 RepID=UPI003ECD10EE
MARRMIKAAHIVGFQNGGHRHLRGGVVVWENDKIIYVGADFKDDVDECIDLPDAIITPGFINTHAHLSESPLDRSFVEDRGPRQFYLSGLFEFLTARDVSITDEMRRAAIAFSVPELIRTGTTTIMEIGGYGDDVIELAGGAGLRVYVGQGHRSGRWYTDDGRSVKYSWLPDDGASLLDRAVAFIEKNEGALHGRIKGFLTPYQVDTTSESMLRRTRAVATEMKVPLALHASQSVPEFIEMTRRHGCTPIEWLNQIGFLGPDVILGHAIMPGGSSWTNYHADDIGILADTGTNVAHAVWVFARRGIAMESFARYLARGVNMTLATDTCPQSMIEALRWTAVVSKIVDRRTDVATASDVFNAATLGGAKALNRDDLGRLAPGAKADMLVWKGRSLFMSPVRDPVRNIVYSAQAEDLHSSIVDGEWIMRDGVVPNLELSELTRDVQSAAEIMWAGTANGDWAKRTIDELSPESFPPFR